jgi:Flp pilus assembly protein TadD
VQLIDGRTGDDEHVWSRSYDVDLVDVLDVQVRIARDVADRLAATFTEAERELIAAGATDDPLAYDLYLRASGPGALATRDGPRDLIRQAISRDPGFSLAWATLATQYFVERYAFGDTLLTDSIRFAFDRAIETAEHPVLKTKFEARRALLLDEGRQKALALLMEVVPAYPSDPDLMMDVANVHWYAGRMAEQARWMRRALELDPLNMELANGLAWLYIDLGLDDAARDVLDRAFRIDPAGGAAWGALSGLHQINEHRDEARAAVDSLYARDEPDALLVDGAVRVWFGEVEEAYEIFRNTSTDVEDMPWWAVGMIAHTALVSGDSTFADRLLTTLHRRIENLPPDPVVTEHLLEAAAIRGEEEESVEALKRYIAAGGRESRWIRRDPIYSRVRSDPRFETELRRLERIVAGERRQAMRDLREGR